VNEINFQLSKPSLVFVENTSKLYVELHSMLGINNISFLSSKQAKIFPSTTFYNKTISFILLSEALKLSFFYFIFLLRSRISFWHVWRTGSCTYKKIQMNITFRHSIIFFLYFSLCRFTSSSETSWETLKSFNETK